MSNRDRFASADDALIDPSPLGRKSKSPATSRLSRSRPVISLVVSMEGRLSREGVAALLATQADFQILGVTGTAAETIALCATVQPDVLVLGMVFAWPRGLSGIAAVRLASPMTQVLALAPHGKDRCGYLNPADSIATDERSPQGMWHATCLPKAVTHGALGALDGDADPSTLFEAVRAVARGEQVLGRGVPSMGGAGHGLSAQELKVARIVGQGASNKEIAVILTISELTVKKHIGNIFQKLGIHDRLQLGIRVARNPTAFDSEVPSG